MISLQMKFIFQSIFWPRPKYNKTLLILTLGFKRNIFGRRQTQKTESKRSKKVQLMISGPKNNVAMINNFMQNFQNAHLAGYIGICWPGQHVQTCPVKATVYSLQAQATSASPSFGLQIIKIFFLNIGQYFFFLLYSFRFVFGFNITCYLNA